jgi:glycosyltransferase involved in cell wall biosynthesis
MAQATIIVPIYQVEKYLRTCFDSLLAQTSQDFQVLAVNDGSKDGCQAIIDEYVGSHPDRFTGITKENGGYGSVLQLAIAKVQTPYFLICDPDDYLDKDAVKTLLDLAAVSGADLTVGAKMIFHEDNALREYDASYNTGFVKLKTNTVYHRGSAEFDDLFFLNPSPHAKLYRKELAAAIRFPEHVGYTDNLLFYISLLNADKVVYTDKPLAYYLVNRTGNSMTDISPRAMLGQITVFREIAMQCQMCMQIPDMFYYRMFESFKFMLYQTRRLNGSSEDLKEVLDSLQNFLNDLTPYHKEILPLYRRYTKAQILERLRDEALISPSRSRSAYEGLKRRMLSEYVPH